MAYFISRITFKVILKILVRFEVRGIENLPRKGPFIIASNHASIMDPAVVGVACNAMPVTFMAKRELFDVPILGPWVRAMGCIPVERDSGNFRPLKVAVQKLKDGGVLGIFPEGRRSPDGRLQEPQAGIGFLASKSEAPIIPIYLSGTDKALAKGKKFISPYKVTARFGKMIDIKETMKISERRKFYEGIGEKVMNAISRLKDE